MSLLAESFFEEDLTTLGSFFSIEYIDAPREWACTDQNYLWRIYGGNTSSVFSNLGDSNIILNSFNRVKTIIDYRGRIRLNKEDLMDTLIKSFSLTDLVLKIINEGQYEISISSVQNDVNYSIMLKPDEYFKKQIRKHYNGILNPLVVISLKIL